MKRMLYAMIWCGYSILFSAARDSQAIVKVSGLPHPCMGQCMVSSCAVDKPLPLRVTPKFRGFNDQLVIGMVGSYDMREFPYPLEDALFALKKPSAGSEETNTVLQHVVQNEADALIAIISRKQMFLCRKGAKTRILMIMHGDVPTWEITAGNSESHGLNLSMMPTYVAVAFLSGITLSSESIAGMVKNILSQDKSSLDAAEAVVTADEGIGPKTVGIFHCARWIENLGIAQADDEDSVVKIRRQAPQTTIGSSGSHGYCGIL